MRRIAYSADDPAVGAMLGEAAWAEVLSPEELADVLRSSLRAEYDGASDAEMVDALDSVLDSMSAAEAFNFGSALGQIGKGVRIAGIPYQRLPRQSPLHRCEACLPRCKYPVVAQIFENVQDSPLRTLFFIWMARRTINLRARPRPSCKIASRA